MLRKYLQLFREVEKRWWVKTLLIVWGIICTYDTIISQFIPDSLGHTLPKAWQIAAVTGGLLSWWAWLLILAGIVILALLEKLVRGQLPAMPNPRLGTPHGSKYDGDSATYITPYQAIHYMADESEWGTRKAAEIARDGMSKNVLLEAPGEFQRRAAEGRIRVYGIGTSGSGHELIDKTHWMTYGLHLEALFKPPFDECHTWPTISSWPRTLHVYSYLRIEAEDVYRTWPRSSDATLEETEEEAFELGYKREAFRMTPGKDAALLRLAQLRTEGVGIRNNAAKIGSTAQLDSWSRKVSAWMREVIEAIGRVSPADSEWFATLDTVSPARVQVPIRLIGEADISMFRSTYNQHDLRLVRLEDLLKKYGVAA